MSLNSKFRSFPVRILVRKDNIDNEVFKREFYTKEKEKDRKDKVLQICTTICWNLPERVSGKQKFFEFEYLKKKFFFSFFFFVCFVFFLFCFFVLFFCFVFLFYRNVSEFIKLQIFFKVLFSRILGWIFFQSFKLVEFQSSTFVLFYFISWEAPFKKQETKPIC